MTNKQKYKQRLKSFWSKVRFKYRLTFFNESTLEEVWSLRLSQLNAFSMLAIFAFLLIAFTAFVIVKTPIRNYLPGYLAAEVRKEIVQNALRADSLERILSIQALYFENVAGILTGTIPIDSIRRVDSLAQIDANFEIPRSKAEEDFIKKIEEEERFTPSLSVASNLSDGTFFYNPVNGIITSRFDLNTRHYGVDLAANPKESVMATLDGTVVFAGFDPNFGYVIHLQHNNGFLSIYKHNEFILKRIGDKVVAGEAISLVGNTGKLSTGPHLHFELWHKGYPVNPEEYISF